MRKNHNTLAPTEIAAPGVGRGVAPPRRTPQAGSTDTKWIAQLSSEEAEHVDRSDLPSPKFSVSSRKPVNEETRRHARKLTETLRRRS